MARRKKIKSLKNARIHHNSKKDWKDYFFVVLVFCLTFVLLLAVYSYYGSIKRATATETTFFVSYENATAVSLNVPAVGSDGKGTATLLTVEAMPGSGRILLDINSLLFWADTEHSMRVARLVAANVTGKDIGKYDLIYNIHANASLIGGESAGAALTLATIAALENKSLKKNVMITGTINHDGTIGPIGGVLEKASAAKDINATLFLVPLLQSRDVIYETQKHCEKFGWTEICTEEQIPIKVQVSEKAGIEIREVSSVSEAMQYFFEE